MLHSGSCEIFCPLQGDHISSQLSLVKETNDHFYHISSVMKKFVLYVAFTLAIAGTPTFAQHVFEVNSTGNDMDLNPGNGLCISAGGVCTLRAAIEEANALPNGASPDVIQFTNIPVFNEQAIIYLSSAGLPAITDPVIINGATASGEVIIDGVNADPFSASYGIHLGVGSSGSKIRHVTVGNFASYGIYVESDDNVIEKNYVGVSKDLTAYPNRMGIYVFGDNNRIGGVFKGNVVGQNELNGIYVNNAYGTIIRGNRVGMDPDGADIGNDNAGIVLFDTRNTIVGGPTTQYANRVGNNRTGISLSTSTDDVTIRNNYIGTDESGTDHGNETQGIHIQGGASDLLIGGLKRFGNVIGFNESGIEIQSISTISTDILIQGNFIGADRSDRNIGNEVGIGIYDGSINNTIGYGLDASIPLAVGKANTIAYNSSNAIELEYVGVGTPMQYSIRGNMIYENGGLGIELDDDGPTANDDIDFDSGPNDLMNYPDVTRAFYRPGSEEIVVEYSISSSDFFINYPLTVDVYLADDSTSGEGKTYIGSDTYLAENVADTFRVDANLVSWAPEDFVVLTAMDADGNTSEFSPAAGALGGVAAAMVQVPGDVIEKTDASSNALALATEISAYPNPFNPQTTITLSLPETARIRVEIHDMLGRQIAMLNDGELTGGRTHTFTFDGSRLASGIYLVRVQDEREFIATKRIMLLK